MPFRSFAICNFSITPASPRCPTLPREAFRVYARQAEAAAYLGSNWYQDIEKLRQSSAALLNAHRDEIAFVKNTSEGISIVANGLEWQFGDKIVTTAVEYPANIYPWMETVRGRGVKLILVPEEDFRDGARHVPLEKILEAASDPRTRLVALSHVEFASGQRHDLAKIGQFCGERKIRFCVDGIQSLGVFPVDVKAMQIDFLSADGHKWLLGPEGAGIFYCRRELLEHIRPLMIGWMNVVNAQEFGNYDYTLRPDAADSSVAATTSPDSSPSKPLSISCNPWESSKSQSASNSSPTSSSTACEKKATASSAPATPTTGAASSASPPPAIVTTKYSSICASTIRPKSPSAKAASAAHHISITPKRRSKN